MRRTAAGSRPAWKETGCAFGLSSAPAANRLRSSPLAPLLLSPWTLPAAISLPAHVRERFWSRCGGGLAKRLSGFQHEVGAVAFSPDGRLAAAGGGWRDFFPAERFIRVWDLEAETFQDLRTENQIFYLAFLPDGRLLFVSGPMEGPNRLYRWAIGAERAELLKEKVTGYWLNFDLSPDGTRLLASTGKDGALLHDLRDGSSRLLARDVSRCRFNKGGTLVVCGGGELSSTNISSLRVIPLDGSASYDLWGGRVGVSQVAISPDDRFIVSTNGDGTVRLWPMPEGEPLLPLPRAQFVERLRSFTNLRVVLDDQSADGWRLEFDPPNPGWETLPTW